MGTLRKVGMSRRIKLIFSLILQTTIGDRNIRVKSETPYFENELNYTQADKAHKPRLPATQYKYVY